MKRRIVDRARYESKEVAQLAQDVQHAIDSVPEQEVITVGPVQYTEPLYVARTKAPKLFHLTRVQQDGAPSAVVAFGAMTWEWVDGKVKIIDIASMSTGATRYTFTFLVME